jgi:type III secretion protein Q
MIGSDKPRAMRPPPSPVALRSICALGRTRHRLAQTYRTQCSLTNGQQAELLIREDADPTRGDGEGLPLSTRFGPAIAYGCAPMLLACSGVDLTQCAGPAAHAALARYAFAALEPALQAALGEPTVCERAKISLQREPAFAVNLLLSTPSIRIGMRWLMSAAGLNALLDGGSWQPVAGPAPPPAWAASLDAAVRLVAGETALPLGECNALRCGDIVRMAATAFDVSGRTSLHLGSHRLHLRWLDSHRRFEVETMEPDSTPSAHQLDTGETVRGTRIPPAPNPIDTATIPVNLAFSLGTLRLTVGEIAGLRPGSLLELKQGLPPQVSIEANGLPIGAGELVDLGGRLAVEITQWPKAGAAAVAP